MREHGAPAVRIGLHYGSAIERAGDYFGAAVNLAARVSAAAVGGEVLMTAQTAALAPVSEGGVSESRGRRDPPSVRQPGARAAAVPTGAAPGGQRPVAPDA